MVSIDGFSLPSVRNVCYVGFGNLSLTLAVKHLLDVAQVPLCNNKNELYLESS